MYLFCFSYFLILWCFFFKVIVKFTILERRWKKNYSRIKNWVCILLHQTQKLNWTKVKIPSAQKLISVKAPKLSSKYIGSATLFQTCNPHIFLTTFFLFLWSPSIKHKEMPHQKYEKGVILTTTTIIPLLPFTRMSTG